MCRLSLPFAILNVAALFAVVALVEGNDDVVVLTSKNFGEVINSHARVLVQFYSPGCGYCKQLAPEYAAAAAELKASGNKAVLAKVDADSESDLGSRHGVEGFPTLKWFVNGKMQDREYDGSRTAKGIVSWVIKRTGPTYIKSNEELDGEIAAARHKPVVIAILSDLNGAVARAFMIAHQDDASRSRAIFLMSSPENMIQGTSSDAIIMMFADESDMMLPLEPAPTAKTINDWIAVHTLPLVVDFSQDSQSANLGLAAIKIQLLAFIDPKKHTHIASRLQAAAGTRRGKMTFVIMDVTVDRLKENMDFFGVTADEAPTIYIVDIKEESLIYKYTGTKGDITTEGLEEFIAAYDAGSLKVNVKSEPDSPEHLAHAVKVVTGNSFHSVVVNNSKDVLVEFYAPWCSYCKKLEPVYLKMAQVSQRVTLCAFFPPTRAQELEMAGALDVVVAKMDVTVNDTPENISVTGYPTIYLFPAEKKQEPIMYSGHVDASSLLTFLRKNARGVIPESTGTKEPQKSDL